MAAILGSYRADEAQSVLVELVHRIGNYSDPLRNAELRGFVTDVLREFGPKDSKP